MKVSGILTNFLSFLTERLLLAKYSLKFFSKFATIQPRKPGSLPTPGAATKTLVQAGHVTPQNLGYF